MVGDVYIPLKEEQQTPCRSSLLGDNIARRVGLLFKCLEDRFELAGA
jgi:hypothetical protein